jgi:hypothetical protein
MLTKRLIAIPARDLWEGSEHIIRARRRPLVRSYVELRPRATHNSLCPKGRAAGGSSQRVEGERRPAAPAARVVTCLWTSTIDIVK